MPIDWFTVGAQALNFLVLVWLMKRFLYQPVLRAIDAREQRVAHTLQQAQQLQAQAQHERDTYAQHNASFEREHASKLNAMHAEVATEKARLLEETRHNAAALRQRQQRALDEELQQLQQHIAQRSQDAALNMAKTLLAQLAHADLQAHMLAVFVAKLQALPLPERQQLAQALAAPSGSQPPCLQVRSAFALTPAQQASLQAAVHQQLNSAASLRFDTTPGLLAGVELSANGHKLAWNLADGLATLTQRPADHPATQPSTPSPTALPASSAPSAP